MLKKTSSQKIIYLADDDEDDRMLFLEAVQDLNLPVVVVQSADGQQLLNALYGAQHIPEVIFLDINMPVKNGFDCLAEIRNAKGDMRNVRIIMLSTSSDRHNIEQADALGADFYAVKPSTFQGLRDLLKKALNQDLYKSRKSKEKFLLA